MLNDKKKKIYFVGVGGAGMAPLALLLNKNGYTVGGTDTNQSLNTEALERAGVPINFSHNKKNIDSYDIVVYSTAIKKTCIELEEAYNQNKTILHRSEILAYFVQKHNSVTVTGTHGKTTTSSILDHILNFKEQRSVSILGGTSYSSKNFIDLNKCSFLVAEADESDGSFLNYHPSVALITNIEEDHLDYYKNYETILQHFKKHISNIKKEGILVYNYDDESCRVLAENHKGNKLSFGFHEKSDIQAFNIKQKTNGTQFTLRASNKKTTVNIPTLGRHNVTNFLGAISAALSLGLTLDEVTCSFSSFKGVKRRLELIHQTETIKIFDDYAHNPGKISACLQTLKKHFPKSYLVTIFQPHRFSRLKTMYKNLLCSLNNSDLILVYPVYNAGETSNENFSTKKIAEDAQRFCHKRAKEVYNIREVINNIPFDTQKNIIISTVGAGNVGALAYGIREHLKCNSSLLKEVS